MALTPSDVEQMTFSTALRGYDLDEVDDFLDQVVVAIRELQDEVAATKAKTANLERNGGDPAPSADESAVGRALVAAQEAADRILEDARTEAESIREDAQTEAETFEIERQQRRDEAEAEMAEHSARIADVRRQLAILATHVADRLDEMDAAVASDDSADVEGEDEQGEDSLEPLDDHESADTAGDGDELAEDLGDEARDHTSTGDEDGSDPGADDGDADQDDADEEGTGTDDDTEFAS